MINRLKRLMGAFGSRKGSGVETNGVAQTRSVPDSGAGVTSDVLVTTGDVDVGFPAGFATAHPTGWIPP
jgi:hypothetical protein